MSDDVETVPSGLHLELMPIPFQKNPVLNMTVITEFTDYGRSLPAASPAHPLYYILHDVRFKPRGLLLAGEKPPRPELLATALRDSLAKNGFLPADTAHPPQFALVYYWGSHSRLDQELAAMFPEQNRQGILERAALVGGRTYHRTVVDQTDPNDFGLTRLFNFAGRENTQYFLWDQASNDLHYAVVSAYSFNDIAHNQRRLAWRTTMTVRKPCARWC